MHTAANRALHVTSDAFSSANCTGGAERKDYCMYGPSRDGRPSLARARTKSAGRNKLSQLGIRPAALGAEEAAAFCGMSGAQFLKEVAGGTMPAPIGGLLSKRKLWSLKALEHAIDGPGVHPPRAIMTAYMLGRYTGQRRGDILRWTRAVYDGSAFRFRQSKTERLERPEMVIPALPPLKAYLDALAHDNTVLFVATPEGAAYQKRHFLAQFRSALDAAGLKHLNFHGLRHAAGVALAEAGATEQEIMRWLGHSTPAMAAHYCAQANQKKLAEAAGRKWEAASKENDS
jgi:integrase